MKINPPVLNINHELILEKYNVIKIKSSQPSFLIEEYLNNVIVKLTLNDDMKELYSGLCSIYSDNILNQDGTTNYIELKLTKTQFEQSFKNFIFERLKIDYTESELTLKNLKD